jgi:hypothetical protein
MASDSESSATSAASHASQHPPPPVQPSVIFSVPNMNHNLSIKLTKGNFMAWRTQILAYIKGQDAYGFLDGSSLPPAQTIPNPSTAAGAPATVVNPDFLAWNQRDQMILSILISTLSEPYVVHAVGSPSASSLWNTLLTMYASQAHARVMQIYFQLAIVKKGTNSITEYFQTIKTLSDTLAAAGQPLNDFESVSFLLKGLGSEYDPFVTSVTTRVDPLSVDELYGHLFAHEMRLEQQILSIDVHPPAANITTRTSNFRGRGFCGRGSRPYNQGRGSFNNRGRGSYFSTDAASSRPICQICGKPGHTTVRCYYQQDQPESSQPPKPYQPSNPQGYYSTPILPAEELWYPDTGATHHLTGHLQNLNLAQEEYHGQDQIRIGDGTGLNISHTGTASLPLSRRKFILQQILHIPSICKNLMSVRKFALDNSVFFEFHASYFLIKDKQTRLLLHHGHLKDGLYQLLPSPSSSSSSINQALVGERTTPVSWHKLLGHPAFRIVHRVLSQFKFMLFPIRPILFAQLVLKQRDINCHFIPLFLKFVSPYN